MRRLGHLPPHWDQPPFREQIHRAFDRWFEAFEAKSMDAPRLQDDLRRLTAEAKIRRRVVFAGTHAKAFFS